MAAFLKVHTFAFNLERRMFHSVMPNRPKKEIEIRKLTEETEKDVLNLMVKDYSKTIYKNVCGVEGYEIDFYTAKRVKRNLYKGCPLGAFETKTYKLLGAAFGSVEYKNSLEENIKKFKKSLDIPASIKACELFILRLERDIFDLLKRERFFYISMGCVQEQYRNKGVLQLLLQDFEKESQSFGCRNIAMISSNEITSHLLKKFNYRVVKEVKFSECYDPENKSLVFPNAKYPFLKLQIMSKVLEDCKNS